MLKRLLWSAVVGVALIPLATFADDPPAPAPTDTQSAATQVQPDAAGAAALGPAASGQTGSSTTDSTTLQGASTGPLQSTTGDSTGLTAPANALQAPTTPDQTLQVIMGESDGDPHHLADSAGGQWAWLAFTVLFAGVLVVSFMFLRRYGSVRLPLPRLALPSLRLPPLRLPGRRPH